MCASIPYSLNIDIVKELINAGANVDAKNNSDITALIQASIGGELDIVKELISAGANVDAIDNSNSSALIYASKLGLLDIVKELISAGANVNGYDENRKTALIFAINFFSSFFLSFFVIISTLYSLKRGTLFSTYPTISMIIISRKTKI
jgi:ankyrin repeat protein